MRADGVGSGMLRLMAGAICACWSAQSMACRDPEIGEVVFYDLPNNLTTGSTILEVHFPQSGHYYPGMSKRPAEVLRVVQGNYSGKTIDVMADGGQLGSCEHVTTSGKTGFVIGKVSKDKEGNTIFLPIYESVEQRELRKGVQRANPHLTAPVVRPFYIPRPQWIRQPSAQDVAREWTDKPAYGGWVRIACLVTAQGMLRSCRVHDKIGSDQMVAAAFKIAGYYQMEPLTREGWSVEGGEVFLRLAF